LRSSVAVDSSTIPTVVRPESLWQGQHVEVDVVVPSGNSSVHRLVYNGKAAAIKVTSINNTVLALRVVSGSPSPDCSDGICKEHGQVEFAYPVGVRVKVYVYLHYEGTISWYIDSVDVETSCLLLPGSYAALLESGGWTGSFEIRGTTGLLQSLHLADNFTGRRLAEVTGRPGSSFSIPDEAYIVNTMSVIPRAIECDPGEDVTADGTACECITDVYGRLLLVRLGQFNPSGRRECIPCQPGTQPEQGTENREAAGCVPCESGISNAETGNICRSCPPGSIPSTDKSYCTNCPAARMV